MKKKIIWIPSLASWMNAILLFLLLNVYYLGFDIIKPWFETIFYSVPELSLLLICLLCWSPLLFITFSHHLIHIGISKIFPKIKYSELDKTKGWFPGIISWWEGLYGWLSLIFSFLTTVTILSIYLLYTEPVERWKNIDNPPTWLLEYFSLLIFINTAYLYHFENIVKQRLLSIMQSKNQ